MLYLFRSGNALDLLKSGKVCDGMCPPGEHDRASVRYEVRRSLRLLVQEAKRQDCFEDVRRFPDLFALFVLKADPVIREAFQAGLVTLQDIRTWLGVLLDGKD